MVEQLTAEVLQANLTKLYWVEGIRWFLLTNAVEVAFFEENGISFSEVALLLSVYNFTNTVAELPSGWLADYIGRKRILVASAAFWAVGFACHVVPTFRMIALGEVLIAVGESLGSGSPGR
jgi:MFS family permease